MGKVIIVSNRLPVSISKKGTEIIVQPSMGGLATGMKSFYKSYESIWIGWPGLVLNRTNKKERDEITGKLKEEKCAPVFLSQKQINQYYLGFSNKTVWPLFHYFPQYTVYQENLWDTYRKVNQIFADEIMKFASEDDIIWIHDYHLLLLPEMVRKKMPGVTIGFFLHIPFPSFEIFRLLPWRKEILKGILGADLVGYHTYDYQRHFISSVRRIFGKEVVFNQIMHGRRKVKVDAFPMGIDYNKFQAEAKSRAELPFSKMSKFQQAMKRFRNQDKEKRVILSIDRLDYSKGIPNRLEAYEHFLEKNPKYREKVILIIVAVPSRTNVEHYQLLKKNVDELVGRINGRFGTINWVPIWYHYRGFQFERLTELYNQADIGLLTPIRDGMNLIAKEYIACKTDNEGVLILSEMAGASKELGEALIVNPNDNKEIANAILEAIKMPRKEQIRRNQVMQKRLERYNVESWAQDFMHNLNKMHSQKKATVDKKLCNEDNHSILNDYKKASTRLILLNYDGTLIDPGKRKSDVPDRQLRDLIARLTRSEKNKIILVSSREKEFLEKYFDEYNITLIADNGVYIKDEFDDWEIIESLSNEWKDDIRPVLQIYMDRTPGTTIIEKDYCLSWDYSGAEHEFGNIRAWELKDELLGLIANYNLQIIDEGKVVEVKPFNINKGRIIVDKILHYGWDFIIGFGDDWTDEYIFEVLPDYAYSVKVGWQTSRAKCHVDSVKEVRTLLDEMSRI